MPLLCRIQNNTGGKDAVLMLELCAAAVFFRDGGDTVQTDTSEILSPLAGKSFPPRWLPTVAGAGAGILDAQEDHGPVRSDFDG